jgi:hypothetical protein
MGCSFLGSCCDGFVPAGREGRDQVEKRKVRAAGVKAVAPQGRGFLLDRKSPASGKSQLEQHGKPTKRALQKVFGSAVMTLVGDIGRHRSEDPKHRLPPRILRQAKDNAWNKDGLPFPQRPYGRSSLQRL